MVYKGKNFLLLSTAAGWELLMWEKFNSVINSFITVTSLRFGAKFSFLGVSVTVE